MVGYTCKTLSSSSYVRWDLYLGCAADYAAWVIRIVTHMLHMLFETPLRYSSSRDTAELAWAHGSRFLSRHAQALRECLHI